MKNKRVQPQPNCVLSRFIRVLSQSKREQP